MRNFPVTLLVTSLVLGMALSPATRVNAANVDEFGAPQADPNAEGQHIYASHCAACHDTGMARAPHPRMLGFLATSTIHKTLTEGVMQSQAAALTAREKVVVAEYLTQAPLGTPARAPQAPRCMGDAAVFNWQQPASAPNWGLTWGNTREVSEANAGIGIDDVARLKLQWAFEFAGAQRARSHPLLAGGAVFTGSQDGTVYALDAATGCIRWTYQAAAEVRTGIAFDAGQPQAGQVPRLFFGDLLGRVYALDARTGHELWRMRADDHPATTITGTPTVYQGRVYVPVSSLEVISASMDDYGCCVFRGSVVALNAKDGAVLWQTYAIDQQPVAQGKNVKGTQNYGPSGAPIWNSPAIDIKRNQLYVGTGENYSSPATDGSDAIFALDLLSGAVRWRYQATANDAWNTACGPTRRANCPAEDGPDFDFGAAPVLTTDSRGRDIVLAAQKSGALHGIDPDTGKELWHKRIGRGGLHGGVHFGIATSGDAAFVPISDANDFRSYPTPARPGLYAVDIKTGDYLWQAPLADECHGREFCDVGIGAAITTTPALVFAGALDGYLRIHAARTGELLRKLDTTAPVTTTSGSQARGGSMDGATAPLPFHGQLFVNSGYNFAGHMPGNVLLVYAVDD